MYTKQAHRRQQKRQQSSELRLRKLTYDVKITNKIYDPFNISILVFAQETQLQKLLLLQHCIFPCILHKILFKFMITFFLSKNTTEIHVCITNIRIWDLWH